MQSLIQKQKNILTVAMVAALSVSGPRTRAVEKENTAKSAKADQLQLQLSVDVPPHWRPFLSDDLAEAFASRVTDIFCRGGYSGEIRFLDHQDPEQGDPVLLVRLVSWRIGHTANAECLFTATLKNSSQEHDLGIFQNTCLFRNDHTGRWRLANALGDVADGALRNLSDRLIKDSLLPGFTRAGKIPSSRDCA